MRPRRGNHHLHQVIVSALEVDGFSVKRSLPVGVMSYGYGERRVGCMGRKVPLYLLRGKIESLDFNGRKLEPTVKRLLAK